MENQVVEIDNNFLKINSYMINDNSEYKKQIAIKLSDFNKLREMAGYKKIEFYCIYFKW